MLVLTAAEMGAVDRRTGEEFGVSPGQLMECAGEAVARFCLREYPGAGRVIVLCGKGNNGGDGLVAARWLARAGGVSVRVMILGEEAELKDPAAEALDKLRRGGASGMSGQDGLPVEVVFCGSEEALQMQRDLLASADLVVDAVVGTGFRPPLRGLAALARELVQGVRAQVVAVDLPSGWDADSKEQDADGAFRADAVVTFTAPKMAHVFGHLASSREAGGAFGPVVVAEIGSPVEAIQSEGGLSWAGASKAVSEAWRGVNGNKGKFGHVLVVGGSSGTFGAPSMSSLAALRTGAGLVTAAVPLGIMNEVGRVTPELMVRALEETDGAAGLGNLSDGALERLMKGISVIAVGPGLSTRGEASEFARRLVAQTTVPLVVDADGLNAFAGRTELLKGAALVGGKDGGRRTVVLTPHPGEMGRLVGMTVKEVEADRVGLALRFATEHQVTLVLKGWRTLVVHPDGRVVVNTTGNPSMAKGGSGDILTGIVAAMLAQYPEDVARAVEAAVYLHGLAGDFAAHAMDEHTVLATDTVAHLSNAFRYRVKDRDGFTWIAGLHA